MRGKLQPLLARFPRGFLLWAGLAALLALGLLSSLADLGRVPAQETLRANQQQQRVIVDAMTGTVSGLTQPDTDKPEFDVAEGDEAVPVEPTEGGVETDEADIIPESEPVEEVVAEPAEETPATEPPVATETPTSEAPAPAEAGPLESLRLAPEASEWPSVARTAGSLVSAPAREITEKLNGLNVPIIAEGGKAQASNLYGRPFKREADQVIVAFVVTDAGFSPESQKMLLALPPEITVGISPYATDSTKQITSLRNAGHEVWAMLPAVTARYPQDDPGPLGLIPALTKRAMAERLQRILSATIGSVGVILPVDEAMSSQPELWGVVLEQLQTRGLNILSTHPTRGLEQLAVEPEKQAIMRRADIILDSTPGTAFIRSKLASVKENAVLQKKLVVLVSARPQSLKILGEWLKDKTLEGSATIAPLSAIYAPDAPPEPPPAPEGGGHGGGEEKADEGGHH